MSQHKPLGPIMLDVATLELTTEDRERLSHPAVGGVILFARNYISPAQLKSLTAAIHALREPQLLIAVDHEGGRVQRFKEGFSEIPAMRLLGSQWDKNREHALAEAQRIGTVIATELKAHGVDFSFAPVLDLDYGSSTVIGDRALHSDPHIAAELAAALVRALHAAGMASVGKHFPGHGYVRADSHLEIPIDDRPWQAIAAADLLPFKSAIAAGLSAIMPAHVIYPAVDDQPAGYSRHWLQTVLRSELGFTGLIFSDDLGMAGAHGAGDIVARAKAAIAAGCDMVLTCNDSAAADYLLDRWRPVMPRLERLASLKA